MAKNKPSAKKPARRPALRKPRPVVVTITSLDDALPEAKAIVVEPPPSEPSALRLWWQRLLSLW